MANGFPLTGVDPNDPRPGSIIEIRLAQGQGSGAIGTRKIAFLAQKTSAGSETANSIGTFIADENDAIERFGSKSEMLTMYRKYMRIDPLAEVYGIAVPEGSGATASTVEFTFTNAATGATTLVIEWARDSIEVPIASGDTAIAIKLLAAAAINDKFDWPWSSDTGSTSVLLATVESPLGPRGDHTLNGIRMYFRKDVTTVVTKGSVTSGTVDDDHTTALGVLATRNLYYQVSCKTLSGAGTATDNGIGEHAAQITSLALPSKGIRQELHFGYVGQSSNVTTIATSLNNARVKMWWAQGTSWTPAMVAAHCAAVAHLKRLAIPAAPLTSYGLSKRGVTEIFEIPKPWLDADLPTDSEIRSALNNGASVILWTATGQAYIEREITTRSLNGTANDYRARSGHIAPCLDFAADYISDQKAAIDQDFVADDPAEGIRPTENTTTPSAVRGSILTSIVDLVNYPGGPVLDPGVVDAMQASVEVRRMVNGTSAKMRLEAPKINDKSQFLILETSPGA